MAEDRKYDGASDDSNDDYFSTNSGIGAIKFRKRLEQLQTQSKKLENLQFQLLTLKNADYVQELDPICGTCIVQKTRKSNKAKKSKISSSDYKVVFKLFTETETERAFNSINSNNNFETVCYSFWKDTFEANNPDLILSYQLIETPYTLFTKSLNNKYLIFLIVGTHNATQLQSYRLCDILQSMIVDLCKSLKITPSAMNQKKDAANDADHKQRKAKTHETRKMSLTAMIEILEEVFGGSGDDVYPLDETEFVTCMRVRIGMESVWGDDTKRRLQQLFRNIVQSSDEIQEYEQKACITFENFIAYFSPFLGGHHFVNDQHQRQQYEARFDDWRDIKYAVDSSPLSKRNRMLREKENISASKYREKLNKIEKLINLLEECIIFTEAEAIKAEKKKKKASKSAKGSSAARKKKRVPSDEDTQSVSDENENGNAKKKRKMLENEQLFWRKKILQHREFVRYYQDVILHEIINENNKMKKKIERLVKLNKFSKKVAFEENEWVKKNEHLLQIEQQYYEILKRHKYQQQTMKQCEVEIQQKDQEIAQLKAQLVRIKSFVHQDRVSARSKLGNADAVEDQNEVDREKTLAEKDRNDRGKSKHKKKRGGVVLNDKISKLKGEIAQKKLEIRNQLNLMQHDRSGAYHNSGHDQQHIKHDRI